MRVYLGSDHGGFAQKEFLLESLKQGGFEVEDKGTFSTDSSDYPDYGAAVARAVQQDKGSRGVLLCRSGEGMEIVANKLHGIRASLVWRPDIAAETRHDNDANILVLPSDFVANHDALTIATTFLTTEFSNEERHQRRIDKISELEKEGL